MLEINGYGEYDCLIVRTDYSDEMTWRNVKAKLVSPQGSDASEPSLYFVDGPAWDGEDAESVLAAVASDEFLSVVFLADGTTMRSAHQALLALNTESPDDFVDGEHDVKFCPSFRTEPAGVFEIDANLRVANLTFKDYAAVAADRPGGVYRSEL
jgi:hypothetical protein